MTNLSTHKAFYKQTQTLAAEFVQVKNAVQDKEAQLSSSMQRLGCAISDLEKVQQPKAIQDVLHAYLGDLNKVIVGWEKKVISHDKGIKIRRQFDDSLLVFVCGKVKAGKSSLGNFMATGRKEIDAVWLESLSKELPIPVFEQIEQTQYAENINYSQGFQVGAAETTSSIQTFTMPGFTWVDSPGLHSVNSENGDLAQEYVNSADLIIYPSNSAQPGRATDLQEIEKLLAAGKRVLVLITRCDEIEEDEDAFGNLVQMRIMKSAQARRDQEHYVQKQLDEICGKLGIVNGDTQVLSISVDYAAQHENSVMAMNESGMNALFEKLQGLLCSEGVELKKQTPMKNLNAFYEALLSSTSEISFERLKAPLHKAEEDISKQIEQLSRIKTAAISQANFQLSKDIDQLVDQYAEYCDESGLKTAINSKVTQAITTYYQEPTKALFEEAIKGLTTSLTAMADEADIYFQDNYQAIEVDVSMKKKAVGGGIGSVLGGAIGFFVGGPAGAAAGSVLGGAVGSAAGGLFESKEMRTIIVGDNREAIKDLLLKSSQSQIADIIQLQHQQVMQMLFSPLQNALQQVLAECNRFEAYVINAKEQQ